MDQAFFNQDGESLAKSLLGKLLVNGETSGRIVETEAYLGVKDPASHAFRGTTPRSSVMFGPGGRAYVYFTYGMHFCFNVVAAQDGVGEAVLIRALEPLSGLELMPQRRGTSKLEQLCNGPAKLVQALGITKAHNGTSLITGPIRIQDDGFKVSSVATSPRIGISRATDLPLRFYLPGSRFVSKLSAWPNPVIISL